MEVDLSAGVQGNITFRNGEKWWCPFVRFEDNEYYLRFEHGEYIEYSRDGKRINGGLIIHPDGTETLLTANHDSDVVDFTPCEWDGKLPTGARL